MKRTELKRGPGPKRKTRMRPKNKKRAAKRYQEHFGDKADYIRQLPCCCCGRAAPSDPHHVRSRGAGGTSKDLVPLSRDCHSHLHSVGRETFEAERNVDLTAKAALFEEWYLSDPQPLGF